MNHIEVALKKLTLGEAASHETLTVHPLLREGLLRKDYLTLDEALARGTARVTEVSETGSVPQLLFSNRGEQAVFLLDGEELVGAKQNRVLNITILAPAGKDTEIPVSCVEAGRWRHTTMDFMSAPRTQFSEGRARKARSVSASLRTDQVARSDQGEVWADIGLKMDRMGSHSDTSAQERMFVDHESRLKEYVNALRCRPGQVGAVFAIRGRPVGVELFDSDETAVLLMPKIIRSYALDAIDPGYRGHRAPGLDSPQAVLERVAGAAYSTHQSVGEGQDLRFDDLPDIAGGALFARDRVVHLCAFVSAERQGAGQGGGYSTSASARRGFRWVA